MDKKQVLPCALLLISAAFCWINGAAMVCAQPPSPGAPPFVAVPTAFPPPVQTSFPTSREAPSLFSVPSVPTPGDSDEDDFSFLPLSRVRQDALGSESTRAVNLITSASPLPSGTFGQPERLVWLGTHYGIKRLEKGLARYYTPADGLPGSYVEAVAADADGNEAYCLVRPDDPAAKRLDQKRWSGTTGQLVFCRWDKQTDKWRAAKSLVALPPAEARYEAKFSDAAWQEAKPLLRWQGKGRIALSARYVAFSASLIASNADAIAYVWDKKAESLRPIVWDAALENSEAPLLGLSFLYLDDARETLWLGTSRGLFAYSLAAQTWRTMLPDSVISAGAAGTSDSEFLYVSRRAAKMPDRQAVPGTPLFEPFWRLVRIALSTGETTELPAPPLTREPFLDSFFAGSREERIPNEPVGLFVDENKQVWVTLVAHSYNVLRFPEGGSGLQRYDPNAKTWSAYALTPRPGAKSPYLSLAPLDTAPNGALLPLTLTLYPPDVSAEFYKEFDRLRYGERGSDSYTVPQPWYWILNRFPHWYGENDKAALPDLVFYKGNRAVPDITGKAANRTDSARVWFVSESDMLASAPQRDTPQNSPGVTLGIRRDAPGVDFFPLQATFTNLQSPVRRMVRAGKQNPSQVIVQSGPAFFLVDTNRKTWDIAAATDDRSARYDAPLISPVGSDPAPNADAALTQFSSGNGALVRRWNQAKRAWEVVADLPVPKNTRLLGAGLNGAAWFTGNYDVWYQEPTPPGGAAVAPLRVAPTLPDAWSVGESERPRYPTYPFAAQGSRIWFQARLNPAYFEANADDGTREALSQPIECLAGYDIVTKKWTPPLPLPRNQTPRLLFTQNRTYVATTAGNPNGCVWEWDADKAAWRVVAPPLPPEKGLFEDESYPLYRAVTPIAVDEKAVWVLVHGRMMARYDRLTDKWETAPLPRALQIHPGDFSSSDRGQPDALQLGPLTFCLSSDYDGLWRMQVSAKAGKVGLLTVRWERIGKSVTVRSKPNRALAEPNYFSLDHVTVTPRYVWAVGSQYENRLTFAARLDKQTKKWTVWGESAGFPLRNGSIETMTADNDSVWVTGQSGAYRFDPAANRWLLVAQTGASARVPEGTRFGMKRSQAPIGHVARVASDTDGVYLLLDSPADTRPNALVWRWDRMKNTLTPLPFPQESGVASRQIANEITLLNEPDVLWVGLNTGLWVLDKKANRWNHPAVPSSVPEIAPSAILRKDDVLLLVGSRKDRAAETHTIRLTSPPFLKRP